jgi:hypothetical protein
MYICSNFEMHGGSTVEAALDAQLLMASATSDGRAMRLI